MKNFAILTDSGSGLNPESIQEAGVYCLALMIQDNNRSYRDGIDLKPEELYDAMRSGKSYKTSSPLMSDIEAVLDDMLEKGYDSFLSIPLSSGLSSTYQTIQLLAEDKGLNAVYLDCFGTCMIQAALTDLAIKYRSEGYDIESVKEKLSQKVTESTTLILPNDLNHLKNGGRLTPLAASLASLLKIRPLLKMDQSTQGKIDVFMKIRTERKALDKALELVSEQDPQRENHIYIIHSLAPTRAEEAYNALKIMGYPEEQLSLSPIAAVIAVHAGLDCLGLQTVKLS